MGWKQNDFLEVVETARKNFIAIFGGQIQYVFPGCTYELYWLSYDPDERQLKEEWVTYCNRTAKECMDKFNRLIATTDIEKEALKSFGSLDGQKENGVNINDFLTFILYFDDNETDFFHEEPIE